MTLSPPRIVSLFPAATEMVCAIGLGERLVGVSHECNWPPEVAHLPRLTRCRIDALADSAAIDSQVKSLAASGAPLYELDAEQLANLRPDLIVAQAQCDVCALSADMVANAIVQHSALQAVRILALNPCSLDDVLTDVERLGVAAGAADQARQCADGLRRRIDAVAVANGRRLGPPPRVAVIEWIDPLMLAGNWTPELVALAGGDYGLASGGRPSGYVSWTDLSEYAPQIVVVAPCGFDLARSRREAIHLQRLPGWSDLPAVRSGQVYVTDGDAYFNRPGPRLIDSLEWLSDVLAAAPPSTPSS